MLPVQPAFDDVARPFSSRLLAAALCLVLAACGGGDRSALGAGLPESAAPATSAASPLASGGGMQAPLSPSAAQQLRAQIARLEQQGVLPTLDRGADIRGPDANDNGVRDDIEAYIAALPLTDPQEKAALQTARVQQRSLLMDLDDKTAVKALSAASMAATACIGDQFEPERSRSYEVSLKIEAITANTPERARRYIQYMAALSGTSVDYPEGDTCEE